MGCNSSVATSQKSEKTGGATLLKAHTTALNGNDSDRKTPALQLINGCAESEEPATPAGNQCGKSVSFQDESQNSKSNYQELPEPIDGVSADEIVVRWWAQEASREGECESAEPEKTCEVIKSENIQTVQPDKRETCESDQPIKVEDGKGLRPKEEKSLFRQAFPPKEKATDEPPKFAKGDFVNIVGPAANGVLDFKGKAGRVVDVDLVGSMPYEVQTEDLETAWFKPSSLTKVQTMGVKVTGDTTKDNLCCHGRDGLFQCC